MDGFMKLNKILLVLLGGFGISDENFIRAIRIDI